MTAHAYHRKSVHAEIDESEWWADGGTLPVVRLEIHGPQGGLQGSAFLAPDAAEILAAQLQDVARAARERRASQETTRVAAQLGYPAEFGGGS